MEKFIDTQDASRDAARYLRTNALREKAHRLIPGGAHTYAKGDDQYPALSPGFLARGLGCRVWDADGNEYIEYGMGLRAVGLGHAYPEVIAAVSEALHIGQSFTRPCPIEVEAAEAFLGVVAGDMVKFSKNGSDVTTAAIKLARAVTGRECVAVCADQPFFSVDDWFIGSTAMNAGIPQATRDQTLKFRYNDLDSLRSLFDAEPGRIACVIMEAETSTPPAPGYLQAVHALCHERGALFVLDEIITGFRWDKGGAQRIHDIQPDLSTFSKAMANGFPVAALTGRREFMALGGLQHDQERVFLLSSTFGADTASLAACMATLRVYAREDVTGFMRRQGERLRAGLLQASAAAGVSGFFEVSGHPANLVFVTKDAQCERSQHFRALFMQEIIRRGVIGPSFVVSYSHTNADIDRTIDAVAEALIVYRRALEDGVEHHLMGGPTKHVFRKYNA
jgi:glutamate-1-semialdehyde 2,1-aminomutase